MLPRAFRGYAAPFNQITSLNGEIFESIAPHAFHDWLSAGRISVRINAFEHYSAALAWTTHLFADSYGLGFQGVLDCNGEKFGLIRSVATGMDRASVGIKIIDAQWSEWEGLPWRIVQRAEIDEITLCSDAVYQGTRVWLGDCPDELPVNLREFDARWTASHCGFRQRNKKYSDFRAAAVAHVLASGKSIILCRAAIDATTQTEIR